MGEPAMGPGLANAPNGRRRAQGAADDPAGHVSVCTEEAIVRLVRESYKTGRRLRAVGSRGSKSGIYRTGGVALHLDGYDRLIAVDGNVVTVQSGMSCGTLMTQLTHYGLALSTWGEWREATVAGAMATGTHGGSGRYGAFSSSVRAIRLVTGEGRVLELGRQDPEFEHAVVSLGGLGVVSTICFECVERFRLRMVRHVETFAQYVRDHDRHDRDNEFHSAIWIPSADRVITFSANRTSAPVTRVRRPERFTVATLVRSYLSRRWRVDVPFVERRVNRTIVGESHDILGPIRISPWLVSLLWHCAGSVQAVEFAIPRARATDALLQLDELLARHPRGLANAIGLRASAQDALSLSPCSGRDTYWVDLFVRADDEAFVAALRELFGRLEARCHWGKHILLAPGDLRRVYPRWEAFRATAARLDPANVFTNRFMEQFALMGTPIAEPAW